MMARVLGWMAAVGSDRLWHFIAGVFVFAAVQPFVGASLAYVVVLAVAVAKEAIDAARRGWRAADPIDAAATVLGGMLALGIALTVRGM